MNHRYFQIVILVFISIAFFTSCIPQGAVIGDKAIPFWRTNWSVEKVSSDALNIEIQPYVEGLSQIVALETLGDGTNQLVAVLQMGQIFLIKDGRVDDVPYLDLTDTIKCCGEQGLLGFAAHPEYDENGLVFVYYTAPTGNSIIARYQLAENANQIDANSGKIILEIVQPAPQHNAGQLKFGPDEMLYISVGDGGFQNKPELSSQDNTLLLGKILRIDVEDDIADNLADDVTYEIPNDNPYLVGGAGEVWASGLRNPWRFSFDSLTGDMYIADVGQAKWEEVNVIPQGVSGLNFGWPVMEGTDCFAECGAKQHTLPVTMYGHDEGCSITGGYVYQGSQIPDLVGTYIFGDFCGGAIWGIAELDGTWERLELFDTQSNISTFGEDELGELYFADYGLGIIYKLSPSTVIN